MVWGCTIPTIMFLCHHLQLLLNLADQAGLKQKINDMFGGEQINSTEDRAVLHVATRARRDQASHCWVAVKQGPVFTLNCCLCLQVIKVDGKNVVPDMWDVLDKIKAFSDKVRMGEWTGATGKPLKDVVAIGIGGSFLGPLFVHTALRYVSVMMVVKCPEMPFVRTA